MIILLPKIVCNCGWSFCVCVRIFVRGQRQQLCMTCRRMQNKDAAVCACVWESGTGHTVEPPVLHSLYPGHSLQSLFVPATDHMSQYLNSCSRWLCVFSLLSTRRVEIWFDNRLREFEQVSSGRNICSIVQASHTNYCN